MKKLAVTVVLMIAVVAIYLEYSGFVIVHDETGMVVQVRLTNANQKQILAQMPFGLFVGIPKLEGGIEVNCSDGSKVDGGYVTTHMRETAAVTGHGTCEQLR